MQQRSTQAVPGLAQGVWWALRDASRAGVRARTALAWRTLWASFTHAASMRRWMAVASEQVALGFTSDVRAEYLRAVRPYVHGGVGIEERVAGLIDHVDWLDTAFEPNALARLAAGEPIVLTQLPVPQGYTYIRLQLHRAPAHSAEGELLLALCVLREPAGSSRPIVAGALAFSHYRIRGTPYLAIGGVRGLRDPRMSPAELDYALSGWKPGVLLVRVAQELARAWDLRLVGLDPEAYRLQGWRSRWRARQRRAAVRRHSAHQALWRHFAAQPGPAGWKLLPAHLDEELVSTALSPERRARQIRRVDFWIRLRNMLRLQLRTLLKSPSAWESLRSSSSRSGPLTVPDSTLAIAHDDDFTESHPALSARVAQTGPGGLF